MSPGVLPELRLFREIVAKARGAGRDPERLKAALAPYLDQHRIAGYAIA